MQTSKMSATSVPPLRINKIVHGERTVTIDTAKRNWPEESGSDDSHGRALWALGTGLSRSNTPTLHNMAARIFQQSLLAILETTNPRAWAFAL